jgi:hypothetical protein
MTQNAWKSLLFWAVLVTTAVITYVLVFAAGFR